MKKFLHYAEILLNSLLPGLGFIFMLCAGNIWTFLIGLAALIIGFMIVLDKDKK